MSVWSDLEEMGKSRRQICLILAMQLYVAVCIYVFSLNS